MENRVSVGIIGCGNISGIYLTNLTGMFKDTVKVAAVCDVIEEKVRAAAEKYSIPKVYTDSASFFADPEIELVVNLTTPNQHCEINTLALNAGKHVYCEKPLATCRADGEAQVKLAAEKGLLLGGAPDTFMGGGIQTARKLIDEGWIGDVVAVNAAMRCHGHESWHPGPAFYYQRGGGPMFDMGPYYLTALVNLVGRVKSVMAYTRITYPQRLITSQPLYGTKVDVEVPTHITGLMKFENGALGTITTTFDVYDNHGTQLEVFGSRGSMLVPDPNGFGGPVKILRPGQANYEDVPVVFEHQENSRGIGVADMSLALRNGRIPRANCEQTFHVLDLMCAFHDSADTGREIILKSDYTRKPALGLDEKF